jgi:Holliday junction resolvase RusA-like endonuclease
VSSQVVGLFIPCSPVAQPRVRVGTIGGHARAFNPTTVKTALGRKPHPIVEFKHAIKTTIAAVVAGRPLMTGAVRVDLEFVFPRPASITKKTKPNPSIPHTKKPDRDNLDKAVLDSLTGVLWVDDCQVCEGSLKKRIAAAGEQPGVRIVVIDLTVPA